MAWSADDYIILFFFVVGALLHGITGFGYPIVGTAVVAGFYPLKVAVAMVVVPGQHLMGALLLFVASLTVRHFLHRRGIWHSADEMAEGGAR